MDSVTDLTSQTVSYLTLIQDICRGGLNDDLKATVDDMYFWDLYKVVWPARSIDLSTKRKRINELVWVNPGQENSQLPEAYFRDIAVALMDWLSLAMGKKADNQIFSRKEATVYASPDFWRQQIRAVLYDHPAERITLVEAIQYMPLQIISVLANKDIDLKEERLLQIYGPYPAELLSKADAETLDNFWGQNEPGISNKQQAATFLKDDAALVKKLLDCEISLPFDQILDLELDEIKESRTHRFNNLPDTSFAPVKEVAELSNDPHRRARQMGLAGLAFSGGGIRSATFNLGLLQRLAEGGWLPRFDYLSTVSGGGYIGSWLTAWIKQSGSFTKVVNRLNPQKSGDPLGDEVRPIRWLRMYSNYLAPDASIMSADAWTIGITWLRNTLINQVILLMLLVSGLAGIEALFRGWLRLHYLKENMECLFPKKAIVFPYTVAGLLLLLLAGLAGLGMRQYNSSATTQRFFRLGSSKYLVSALRILLIVISLLISIWMYTGLNGSGVFTDKLWTLLPGAIIGFICMVIVAFLGGYHRISATADSENAWLSVAIVLSSLVAVAIGSVCLAGVWQLMAFLSTLRYPAIHSFSHRLILVTSLPLILEVFAVTVVVRMALMGDYFPDERREWWGRMGALIHRFMLFWLLISFCALLLPGYLKNIGGQLHIIVPIFGGWSAIIGAAVKLAYQPDTDSTKDSTSSQKIKNIFVGAAPYLFMLGVFLLGSYTLIFINHLFHFNDGLHYLYLALVLATVTLLFSWRVGVNDFSLHDFYRNRLVRAYLGAVRRRTDREMTVNKFTGFDTNDDFPLASLQTAQKYYGPYPLINTALNATIVSDLDRQDRKAESFIFSPIFCGFDFNPNRSAAFKRQKEFEYGYRPTEKFSVSGGPLAGTAMAISGAAVNPNMGYHSSPAIAFLLTIFNVRLGRWIGNPATKYWKRSDPMFGLGYLLNDLFGQSDISSKYICLSDGGHFDNMGLYELVRRRCTWILLGDAEEDEQTTCEGLANAIRRCRIDFGVEINLDISPITVKNKATGFCKNHVVQGTIKYNDKDLPMGNIIYVKTSLTGDESVDVREYFMNNPDFPQQSTGDQFFDEAQFESYRKLGYQSL